MKKSRRKFIKDTGIIAGALAINTKGFSTNNNSLKIASNNHLVVCIFQRGAADGLHSIIPYGDQDYFNLRPVTAVNNSIDLDGFYGLNPELAALKPLWDAGDLGIIHAVGSPNESRSHFDAQDSIEFADFDKNHIRSGWLAKYINQTRDLNTSVFRALSLNNAVSKSIKGNIEALTVSGLNNFDILTHENLSVDTRNSISELFNNDIFFADTASVLFSAIDIIQSINPDDYPIENGASYPENEFGNKLKTLSTIVKADLGTEIACIDIGGWDHHNNISDNFKKPANTLALGLQAFYQDMGDRMQNITILCMTEFGRRASENASQGTDHGHAGVMYAIGKRVNGGQIYSQWPGLSDNNLNRGDLEVTTDFREVFSELLIKQLNYLGNLSDIIPQYTYKGGIGIFQ